MAMRRPRPRTKPEPTIALINIVFLMLIFFMIAGVLAPPLDDGVTLVETSAMDGRTPPDAPVVDAEGQLSFRGLPTDVASVVALAEASFEGGGPAPVRLVPDRDLPAETLLDLAGQLSAAGAGAVWLVTEKGLK